MGPLISVSIGVYNREGMIANAIESVLAQTYTNFELIIIDNGSIDRSGEIAEEYAAKDERVRVIHLKPNLGVAVRYDLAIEVSRGEFITYIDDDDYVEPDFLEFMYQLIQENNADVSICACPDRGATGEKLVLLGKEALIEMFQRKRFNARPSAKLYRRKLMKDIRFPAEAGMGCDGATLYKVLANADRVAFSGVIKYFYNRHEGMTSHWTKDHAQLTPEILDEYGAFHRERTEWLSKRFPDWAEQFLYYELSFDISMVEKINRYNLVACQPQLQELVKKLQTYKEVFLKCEWIRDFEKEWMEKYVL